MIIYSKIVLVVLLKKILIKLIKWYQITPLASHKNCRFIPTCSNYGIQAIERFGALKGSYLTIKRIIRCNPFTKKYGYDPVPNKEEKCEKNI